MRIRRSGGKNVLKIVVSGNQSVPRSPFWLPVPPTTENVMLGFGLLVVALPFFVAGLDDDNDPFRVFHGMWHLTGGFASLYLWRVVKYPGAVMLQPLTDRTPSSMV